MGRFIDRDQFQRALDLRACQEILEILARQRRVLEAWDKYRSESKTTKCDLLKENWLTERRSELDDAYAYEVLQSLSMRVVVEE